MSYNKPVKRYDVYWVNLDPTRGKEIKKTRPCVIASPDVMNNALSTLLVAPITSTIIDWPFRITLTFKNKKSSIACDQLRSITKERLGRKIATLSAIDRRKLTDVLQEIFAE